MSIQILRRMNREEVEWQLALRGWTWRELHLRTGISFKTLSKIRRNQPVSVRTIAKIADAFRATMPDASMTDLLAVAQ